MCTQTGLACQVTHTEHDVLNQDTPEIQRLHSLWVKLFSKLKYLNFAMIYTMYWIIQSYLSELRMVTSMEEELWGCVDGGALVKTYPYLWGICVTIPVHLAGQALLRICGLCTFRPSPHIQFHEHTLKFLWYFHIGINLVPFGSKIYDKKFFGTWMRSWIHFSLDWTFSKWHLYEDFLCKYYLLKIEVNEPIVGILTACMYVE